MAIPIPYDLGDDFARLWSEVQPFTMTTPERVFALREAVRYVVGAEVPEAVVECGVWRGGSMMAVARTLLALGVSDRDLYLFDTFEGMTPPTEADARWCGRGRGGAAQPRRPPDRPGLGVRTPRAGAHGCARCRVRRRPHPVREGPCRGDVARGWPEQIALLRLDTDWYELTRHELEHLFPRSAAAVYSSSTTTGTGAGHGRRPTSTCAPTGSTSC